MPKPAVYCLAQSVQSLSLGDVKKNSPYHL